MSELDRVHRWSAEPYLEGFAAFYREWERPVLGYFMGKTSGRADLAVDLAAETFAQALECRGAFDPARGRADQWLFGIARNVFGKSVRRGQVEASARRRLSMPALLIDEESLAAIERVCEDGNEATLALAGLPEGLRDAVQMRVVEERDYEEIARELECSEAVVRKRVSRGVRTLRGQLDGER